ncbi:hypothetical protein AB0L71_10665 [Streptomyces sp. NPDC052052]|uniref:hypothetical protein n=1 Tax=Streptomyces sp. NPDC052052 TaxID=3154756 RepID=UPI003437AC05
MRTHESPGRTHRTPLATPVRNSPGTRTPADLQSTMGNAAVSQLITVSRMMSEGEFKQSTSKFWPRGRSEITRVDEALAAFHALPETDQRGRLFALKDIVKACRDYTEHKEGGSRVDGTEQLRRQAEEAQKGLDLESVYQGLLTEIDRMRDPDEDQEALGAKAQTTAQTMPADRFQTMMHGYVGQLADLLAHETLPEETRAVIGELMEVVHLVTVMQYPMGSMPGMRLNPATDGDGQSFTFNVDTQALGGTSFLLGHIAHELTHVAAHQAFGSSPVMELVRSGTSDSEVTSLAAERKRTLDELQKELSGNAEFNGFQQRILREKLVYGAQPHKLEKYADAFAKKGSITAEQKERLIGWGKAAGEASGTLVEYDTVLNQMLVYLHMWQTSQDNPFYVKLRAAAKVAYDRRRNTPSAADQQA